jgi:nucleotide-binding universal stress UspA family protein
MSWKRICCPVDFSRESRIAMDEAAHLAWRFDGNVTLVHVNELPVPPPATELLAPPETFVLGAVDLDRKLNLWRDDAEKIAGTSVDVALLSGAPAVAITRFARDSGFDVIVMGTRREEEREHLGLGSVAEAVVREAPCTVVVVRRGPSPPPSVGPS